MGFGQFIFSTGRIKGLILITKVSVFHALFVQFFSKIFLILIRCTSQGLLKINMSYIIKTIYSYICKLHIPVYSVHMPCSYPHYIKYTYHIHYVVSIQLLTVALLLLCTCCQATSTPFINGKTSADLILFGWWSTLRAEVTDMVVSVSLPGLEIVLQPKISSEQRWASNVSNCRPTKCTYML